MHRSVIYPNFCAFFRHRSGFTLIELMVAIVCMAILITPIVYVYRSGSRTALSGLVKAEITGENRFILRQIYSDLKYSVFFMDYSQPPSKTPSDYFQFMISGNSETVYSILRFPIHGSADDFIESSGTGTAYRSPIKVTYELKKENSLFYSLYRKEGNNPATCLSKRVNFFEIRENNMAPEKAAWFVTLQLAEAVRGIPSDSALQQVQAGQARSVKAIERRLTDRTSSVQIADFFLVVASEYYTVFRKSRFIPNWQNLLKNL